MAAYGAIRFGVFYNRIRETTEKPEILYRCKYVFVVAVVVVIVRSEKRGIKIRNEK